MSNLSSVVKRGCAVRHLADHGESGVWKVEWVTLSRGLVFGVRLSAVFGAGFIKDDLGANNGLAAAFGADCFTPKVVAGVSTGVSSVSAS